MLTCLKTARLLLKLKKCKFYKELVKFLGFIISIKGLKIDPNKIKLIIG